VREGPREISPVGVGEGALVGLEDGAIEGAIDGAAVGEDNVGAGVGEVDGLDPSTREQSST